jgi:hypothetical protein
MQQYCNTCKKYTRFVSVVEIKSKRGDKEEEFRCSECRRSVYRVKTR